MVEERGYTSQVAPGGPGRAVLASPDAYGAGIGAQIERAGDQLHQRQLRSYQLDRQEAAEEEAAARARQFSTIRAEDDAFDRELERTAAHGGAGHADAVRQRIEKRREELLDGIAEDKTRRQFAVQYDEYAARREMAAEAYQAGARKKALFDDHIVSQEQAENRIATNKGNPATLIEESTFLHTRVAALDATDDEKDAIIREGEQGLHLADVNARNKYNPEQVRAQILAGQYDAIFTPEQRAAGLKASEVQIEANALEAEERADEARGAAREELKVLSQQVAALETVPEKVVASAVAKARAAGVKESEIQPFLKSYDDARRAEPYSPEKDPTGTRAAARIAELAAKVQAGTATGADRRLLDTIRGVPEKRAAKLAEEWSEEWKSGQAGQLSAIERAAALPTVAGRFAAARAYDNGEGTAGYIALLPSSSSRALAINGSAVLKARPKDFGEKTQVEDAFRRAIGGVAPSLGSSFDDMQSLAWQVYAGLQNATGETGWDQKKFNLAVRVATGATKRTDGVLQGGVATVRERRVLLPDTLTADEFDARLSRLKFTAAVYADGREAQKADVLSRYRPEWFTRDERGRDWYRMMGPAQKPLMKRVGGVLSPYSFTVDY